MNSVMRAPIFNAKKNVSGGVWIKPDGNIFGVPLTHIRAVIEDPSYFGFSKEQLKRIFKRHGEGVGSEGDGRDEVISLLISNGWVRIRYHPGDYGFHIKLRELNSIYKEYLHNWASKLLSKEPEKDSLPVRISVFGAEITYKLSDLL